MTKKKTVIKPGYHLFPKWDLHGLRARRTEEKKVHGGGDLPLVSMIDMFTILVIFLLMNFSATGEIFFLPKNMKLPEAIHTHPLESAPLITITDKEVILDVEKVGDNPLTITEKDANLPQLIAALKKLKEQIMIERPGQTFKGNINIQSDEQTELIYIKRVMQACINVGWMNINFAVKNPDSSQNAQSTK